MMQLSRSTISWLLFLRLCLNLMLFFDENLSSARRHHHCFDRMICVFKSHAIEKVGPRQVMVQILCRDSVKADHPSFEPTMVIVRILNVVDAFNHTCFFGRLKSILGQSLIFRISVKCTPGICAEHIVV